MQIRNLRMEGPEDRRYWTAELVDGETRIPVDRKHGSWQAETDDGRHDVLPWMARRLQEKVRPLEKRIAAAEA